MLTIYININILGIAALRYKITIDGWTDQMKYFITTTTLVVCWRNEMFYLTTHSTHFIYGYMASDMVKDHSDGERGNPLPPRRLLFPINSKGSFICTIPQTG